MSGFDWARSKICRADKHICDLELIVSSLPDSYVSTIEVDPQGRGHSIKYEVPDFHKLDTSMALLIGDAVHNLKTALDYSWITATKGGSAYSKFPVRNDAADLANALRGAKIHTTCPALFEWITSTVKPYATGNFHLSALHRIDIADKHRLLLPVIRNAHVSGITVEDEQGRVSGESPGIPGVNTFRFDFNRNIKIHKKGQLSVEVFFDEALIPEGLEVMDSLRIFRGLAIQLVNEMEKLA